jgi:hypothetical protein
MVIFFRPAEQGPGRGGVFLTPHPISLLRTSIPLNHDNITQENFAARISGGLSIPL